MSFTMTRVLIILSLTRLVLSFSSSCSSTSPIDNSPQAFAAAKFDYVIVGGGTAGLALASRLAENPNLQIGVIEAGTLHQNDPLVDVPHNVGASLGNPAFDWNFATVPQPAVLNKSIHYPRGKIVGGSSALNFLAWTRASKEEYDAWESFVPGSTWNWEGLLPYFKKACSIFLNQTNPFLPAAEKNLPFDSSVEGLTGPIQASLNDLYIDPVAPYIKGLNAIGIETNPNPDSGNSSGVGNNRMSINRTTGVRSYAGSTYYCRSVGQPNFHVLTNAQATKLNLHFDTKTNKQLVTGVQFMSGSKSYTVNVIREVILSAGVYQSPQLLELSGIGNKQILDRVGIKTLINNPSVGENLQDHLGSPVQYLLEPGIMTFDEFRNNATFANEQANIYNATRKGFVAATNSISTFVPLQAFVNASSMNTILQTFDQSVAKLAPSPFQLKQYSIQRQWLQEGLVPQVELILFGSGTLAPAVNQSYITVVAGQMHHVNRGSVHINTSMPLVAPVIDPKWLNNNLDLSIGLEAMNLAILLGGSPSMTAIIQERTDPSPNTLQDPNSLLQFFKENYQTFDHPMGTNAMALQELGGVVDDHLKVYGTLNLRICDASIIPMSIGTHLQQTVYAIAEKLADLIKSCSQ